MTQKLIGMPGWTYDGRFGVSIAYIEFMARFGLPVILTPQHQENPPELDLLVLPGGGDINPFTYGQTAGYRTGQANVMLENFDSCILPEYIKRETPIFGICRGAQKLWTIFGGHLEQHYPHHAQASGTLTAHPLSFTEEFEHMAKDVKDVTSRHHQVMQDNYGMDTPADLEVIAYAKERVGKEEWENKEVIEIFRHRNKLFYGVQFHPEDHNKYNDIWTDKIINGLLNN